MKVFDIVPKKMPPAGAPPEPARPVSRPPELPPEPEPIQAVDSPASMLEEFGPLHSREDATARRGGADDRREDATARRGGADDRREDATARRGGADDRRYNKSVTDLLGKPRPTGAGEEDRERLQHMGVFTKKEKRPPLFEELRTRVRRRLMGPTWLVLAGIVALGAIGALTFLYPRVTVAVTAKQLETPVEVFVTMDGKRQDTTPEEGRIRGKIFSSSEETTRTFPTTGKDKVVAKAAGTITIFNAFSAKPQALVATTRFESPDGKIFRLIKAATVPGATVTNGSTKPASIAAEVQADQPGPDYNIGPADFTIPGFKGTLKFTGFYAKSYAPMKGGAEGHTAVVTENDLANARRVLREELTGALADKLAQSLPQGWTTLSESTKYEIVAATPSASPGTAADNFQMRFKLALTAMSYPETELETLFKERLKEIPLDIPSETSDARIESIRVEQPRLEESKQLFSGLLKATVTIKARLDRDVLKQEIMGKREAALKEYLRDHESIKNVKVTFWPFWVKRVPRRESLVTVTID